jgi:hypothetical protein
MGSRISKPVPWVMSSTEERMNQGSAFLSYLWELVAGRVVEEAIKVYGLDDSQAAALRTAFLRPSAFVVEPL